MADRQDITIIADIEEESARAFLDLASQVGQHIVAVNMNFEGLVASFVTIQELLLDVRITSSGQECGQPVLVGDDAIQHRACLDLARPAHEGRHAPAAFPVGVLLSAEWGDAGIRPGVVVRPVIRRVHHDGVFGNAEFIELVQHHADVLIMGHHGIVIEALAALAFVLLSGVGAEVHGRGVVPQEERLAILVRLHR